MRRFDTPYLADWLATSLRWVVLVGLLISLSLRGELGSLPFGLLMVMLGWNILNSILAILSIRLKTNHRQIVLGGRFPAGCHVLLGAGRTGQRLGLGGSDAHPHRCSLFRDVGGIPGLCCLCAVAIHRLP